MIKKLNVMHSGKQFLHPGSQKFMWGMSVQFNSNSWIERKSVLQIWILWLACLNYWLQMQPN